MNYYLVKAKCGHVGKGYYIEKTFPVYSNNKSETAQSVLTFPRVKKQNKKAIISVNEVSEQRYNLQKLLNKSDLYLHATCSRDYCCENEIYKLEKRKLIKKYFEFSLEKKELIYKLRKDKFIYEVLY